MKIAIATLGCKVNQYESAGLIERFRAAGFSPVPFNDGADIYIINTCTVTARTDYQSRQLIRRVNRMNPAAKIVVTGCYAQMSAGETARLPGVVLVAGNAEKADLPNLLRLSMEKRAEICVRDIRRSAVISDLTAGSFPGRTRAFLRIQDGCDSFCTYCIVPFARGPSRSLPEKTVLEEAARLSEAGYREIVLTGIHLGQYGPDLDPPATLLGLLKKIEGQDRIRRIRLSSIEPLEITPEMIAHMRESRMLCRHLHIPLQSGDEKILERMGRHYGPPEFRRLVESIAASLPDVAIGIDVLAGFPGEGEREFENTLQFIAGLPVAYLHVFPYSKRPGTAAAGLPDQVKEEVKKSRARILRSLGAHKRERFAERFIGRRLSVLVESKIDRVTGLAKGFSDNYIPVLIREGRPSLNSFAEVTAEEAREGMILGRSLAHG